MEKYRKKPVVIEAYQWHREMRESEGVTENPIGNPMLIGNYYCITLEGNMMVKENDWVIKGIKGEYYPCKPDIFKMTYEKVNKE